MWADCQAWVKRALLNHDCTNTTVVVAVSGGVDSMTLLDITAGLAMELELTVIVAHAHHGLREEEADLDQQFVRDACTRYDLEFESARLPVYAHAQEHGHGIEASARELRYRFLLDVASKHRASVVLVGHTADDVAETLIMHIARGSGINGIASHPMSRPLSKTVSLLRPLYSLQRSDVIEYVRVNKLLWREDSSNADQHFLRNRVRTEVIPALRSVFGTDVTSALARTAELLGDAKHIVREAVSKYTPLIEYVAPFHRIAVSPLRTMSSSLQRELIRELLHTHTSTVPSHTDTQRVMDLVDAEVGSSVSLQGTASAWREREYLTVVDHADSADPDIELKSNGTYVHNGVQVHCSTHAKDEVDVRYSPHCAYVDTTCIVGRLHWRVWRQGERFVPFGMNESVLVADVLTSAHVPIATRKQHLVVADDEGVLWICGIRPAERTRVTASTTTITLLSIS